MKHFLNDLINDNEVSKNPFKAAIGFIVLKFEDNDKDMNTMESDLKKVHDELLKLKLTKLDCKEFEELSDLVNTTYITKVDKSVCERQLRDYAAFKAKALVYIGLVSGLVSLIMGVIFYFITQM